MSVSDPDAWRKWTRRELIELTHMRALSDAGAFSGIMDRGTHIGIGDVTPEMRSAAQAILDGLRRQVGRHGRDYTL